MGRQHQTGSHGELSRKKMHFIFLCRNKGYGIIGYDLQKNDIGIAKCHFDLTAKELGIKGSWLKDKDINVPDDWEYIVSWIPD